MRLDGAALGRTLQTESDALTEFINLLLSEQQALVRGELESLASFAESKSICLFELTRLGEQRAQWLRERGLQADRAGMERLLRDHAGDAPQLLATWRQLLTQTQTAQQLNDGNGALIGTRLSGTQRALNVLFSAANIVGTYASDGSTVCVRSKHTLAVA
jgi:flagellar biosynthesis/type III secretory pathway chaperone